MVMQRVLEGDDIDRFYMSRKEGGIELTSIDDC